MNINSLAKATVPVVIGVILAGVVLSYGREIGFLNIAHQGFDY